MVFYVEGCILFSVHLLGVNKLSACREFCGVHSKMAQDVGMV